MVKRHPVVICTSPFDLIGFRREWVGVHSRVVEVLSVLGRHGDVDYLSICIEEWSSELHRDLDDAMPR